MTAFLGNTELLNQLTDDMKIESENVCCRLHKGDNCGRSIEDEITFATSHLSELDLEDFGRLDMCLTERILTCPALRLRDEDSLLELIRMVDCDGPILHRYLFTEYWTDEPMTAFLNFLSSSDLGSPSNCSSDISRSCNSSRDFRQRRSSLCHRTRLSVLSFGCRKSIGSGSLKNVADITSESFVDSNDKLSE
jgi:hypothetical protein